VIIVFLRFLSRQVHVYLIVDEANNGESLSQPDRPNSDRHNAKRLTFAKRQAIIYALANHESVESIRRTLHTSRHIVLAVRGQYPHEIEAAQEDIKNRIALAYAKKSLDALEIIGQRIAAERSPLKQIKLYDMLTERMQALQTPVQKNSYPMSIKLAALRRAKRNQAPVPSA
jgi:hypothetical protein